MTTRTTQRDPEQISVRQVTHMQASWTEQDRAAPGAFTVQLILDNGVEEYILRPTADDARVLFQLFQITDYTTFDTSRKTLIFGNVTTKAS